MSENIVKQLFEKDLGKQYGRSYDFLFSKLRCFIVRDDEDSPIFACKLARCPKYEHVLAIAGEDGRVFLMTSVSDSERFNEEVLAHYNAVFDISWMNNDMKFITASGDQSAVLWDVTGDRPVMISRFLSHSRSVKVAAFAPESNDVFVTGCRGGTINVWDIRAHHQSRKAENSIVMCHVVNAFCQNKPKKKPRSISSSITGLDFRDSVTIISCSAGDGCVKFWDIRKPYSAFNREPQPVFQLPYPGSGQVGYSYLHIDHTRHRLFVNGIDSSIYAYNLASVAATPVCIYSGHENNSNYIKSCLSPDGRYLISGSSDGNGYVWRTSDSLITKIPQRPVVRLLGHRREMTCMAWRRVGDIRIYTCGDDGRQMVWKVDPGTSNVTWSQGHAQKVNPSPKTIRGVHGRRSLVPTRFSVTSTVTSGDTVPYVEPDRRGSARRLFSRVDSSGEPGSNERVKRLCHDSSSSITSNLPNYVIDGTSPHVPCQPKAQCKENRDWLTKLRETLPKSNKSGNGQSASPKSSQSRAKASPKSSSNLLNYFRVLDKAHERIKSDSVLEEKNKWPDDKSEESQDR